MVRAGIIIYVICVLLTGMYYIKVLPDKMSFIKIVILALLVPLDALIFLLNILLFPFKLHIKMQYAVGVKDVSDENSEDEE